jgi:ketosteroid isomerase-like protein
MDESAIEETVRSYYDRIDAGDEEGVFELFAEDVTYHRPGQEPIEGMNAFREFYLEGRPLSAGTHEVRQVLVDGDAAAVRGRFTGEQGGEPVGFGFADVHRFEGGKIVERHSYTDRDTV